MMQGDEDELSYSQGSSTLLGCDIAHDGSMIYGLSEWSQDSTILEIAEARASSSANKNGNDLDNNESDDITDSNSNPKNLPSFHQNQKTLVMPKRYNENRLKASSPTRRIAQLSTSSPPILVNATINRKLRDNSSGLTRNAHHKAEMKPHGDVAQEKNNDPLDTAEQREKYGMLSRIGKLGTPRERSGYTTCTSHTDYSLHGSLYDDSSCDDSDSDDENQDQSISISSLSSDALALRRNNNLVEVDIQAKNGTTILAKPRRYEVIDEKHLVSIATTTESLETRRLDDSAGRDSFELFDLPEHLRSGKKKQKKNSIPERYQTKYCALIFVCSLFATGAVVALIVIVHKTFFSPPSTEPIVLSANDTTPSDGTQRDPALQDWESESESLTTSMFRGGPSVQAGFQPKQDAEDQLSKKREVISNKLLMAVEDLMLLLDGSVVQFEAVSWLAEEATTLALSDDELVQRFSARVIYLSFFDDKRLRNKKRAFVVANEHQHECYWKSQNDIHDEATNEELFSTATFTDRLFKCNEKMIITAIFLPGVTASDGMPYELMNFPALSTLKIWKTASIEENSDSLARGDVVGEDGASQTKDDDSDEDIFDTLSHVNGLTHLTLNLQGINSLRGISKLSGLKHLELAGGTSPLPSKMAEMTNLESLIIRDFNHLGSNEDSFVPSSLFGALTKLKVFKIENSSMSGNILDEIEFLSTLEELVISGCPNVDGPIPPTIGTLHNLIHLDLSSNGLESSIPPSLLDLKSLQVLNLSRNRLDKGIPMQIDELENLIVLDLSDNRLEEPIPQEAFDRMAHLESLSLEGNLFLLEDVPITPTAVHANLSVKEQEQLSAAKPRTRHRESALAH